MASDASERKSQEYIIQLPLSQALEVRDQLKTKIWEIAREEGVSETLQEAKFDVQVGKPALEPGTIITVIFVYLAMKAADKATDKAWDTLEEKVLDKAWEAFEKKVLPKLKQWLKEEFGRDVLVKKDDSNK